MSLKARIEAVIYAAEEPVTLPQLAAIFREEALASRAARLAVPADPEAPTEADVTAEIAPAIAPVLASAEESPEPTPDAGENGSPEPVPASGEAPDATKVRSELAAQESADAALATPDFEGQPQPFPNQPPEATTPDPPIPPESVDDAWREPAFNAVESPAESSAESDSDSAAEIQDSAAGDESAPDPSAETGTPPALTPEDEKRLARHREREAREEIRRLIDELIAEYAASDRGVEIREIAGGFRMATRAEYHDAVRSFVRSLKPPMKLSLQALETLAVIAYKQPITAPEIAEVRGVDSGGVLGSLVARKLITTAGRKQVVGRPILYKTTKEFLLRFGLKDLNELPSLEEFEKMASELAEQEEPPAEQIPLAQNAIAAVEEDAESASQFEEAFEPQRESPAEQEFDSGAADPLLPVGEPEVAAAASEPVESRHGAQPGAAGTGTADHAREENPEPALAGAETDPEPPLPAGPVGAPATETDLAAGPGDGDPPPPPEEPPAAHASEGDPS
jgi:segregation and condensation protein B